jgi:rod shape-determining protein MreC
MEYSPPPLFKQGAPARVKVTVFALISIALLMIDSRLHSLQVVRQVAGTLLYPFQLVAMMPRDAIGRMNDYFTSQASLQKEVRDLKSAQVATALSLQQSRLFQSENVQLRRLMEAREHLPVKSLMSEILYDARDPSTRKIVLDRGIQHGVATGLPVIDSVGVVGQVTRVFPFTSEVTLLTDKEQAIPVQVLRNGLRSVAYGRGQSGLLDLRFMATDADIQVGDILITSGLDGVYPAGLAVAKVVQVESNAAGAFGHVVCQPLAGIDRNRQLLILMQLPELPPRPTDEEIKSGKKHALPKMIPLRDPPPAPPVAEPAKEAATVPAEPVVAPAGAGQAPVNATANAPAPAPVQKSGAPAGVSPQAPKGVLPPVPKGATPTGTAAAPATAAQTPPATAPAPAAAKPKEAGK